MHENRKEKISRAPRAGDEHKQVGKRYARKEAS
jgi:hypothetical protein